VGDWKNYTNEEREKRWKEWIENNLDGSDINFHFEIDD
jgi:hypothetical protein